MIGYILRYGLTNLKRTVVTVQYHKENVLFFADKKLAKEYELINRVFKDPKSTVGFDYDFIKNTKICYGVDIHTRIVLFCFVLSLLCVVFVLCCFYKYMFVFFVFCFVICVFLF